jgi:hypothetical protein
LVKGFGAVKASPVTRRARSSHGGFADVGVVVDDVDRGVLRVTMVSSGRRFPGAYQLGLLNPGSAGQRSVKPHLYGRWQTPGAAVLFN